MRPRAMVRRIVLVGAMASWVTILAACGAEADCTPVTIGMDTTSWNSSRGTHSGRAVGQTFYAADTLISRITVWRAPNNLTFTPNRLFVTTVDTVNYDPPRPITQGILQNGPTVLVPNSDPPGLPIRMDFVLDPPLALPHPGTFAFFVQREGCDAGGTEIIAKEPSAYPFGMYWITGRASFLPCHLPQADTWEDLDLCFEIGYCRDIATPVRRETWGRLKVIYR